MCPHLRFLLHPEGDRRTTWGSERAHIAALEHLSQISIIIQHSSLFQYYMRESFSTVFLFFFLNLKFILNHFGPRSVFKE